MVRGCGSVSDETSPPGGSAHRLLACGPRASLDWRTCSIPYRDATRRLVRAELWTSCVKRASTIDAHRRPPSQFLCHPLAATSDEGEAQTSFKAVDDIYLPHLFRHCIRPLSINRAEPRSRRPCLSTSASATSVSLNALCDALCTPCAHHAARCWPRRLRRGARRAHGLRGGLTARAASWFHIIVPRGHHARLVCAVLAARPL